MVIRNHVDKAVSGAVRSKWLLRNHLVGSIDQVTEEFSDLVYDNCKIIGFKEIRLNMPIGLFINDLSCRVVFVVRDPRAVIASIVRRSRFWEEFGWDFHWGAFLERVIFSEEFSERFKKFRDNIRNNRYSKLEKIALMWAATHSIAVERLRSEDVCCVKYEDFYQSPFDETRKLLNYVGVNQDIHPSYIFTPSLMTHRTLHGLYRWAEIVEDRSFPFFWSGTLSRENVRDIDAVVAESGLSYPILGG